MTDPDAFKKTYMQTAYAPIIIYTMGKVASSSVSNAILDAGVGCYDVHFLAEERMTSLLQSFFANDDFPTIPPHMIRSLQAYNSLRMNKHVKVISMLREPVSRNVSSVFQNLPKRLEGDDEAILERLRRNPPHWPDVWFEDDFIPTMGIDFFNVEVDRSKDVFRFRQGNIDLMILKSHVPDRRKEALIGNFLDMKITIERQNDSSDKWYGETYSEVMGNLGAIGSEYVEKCLNCQYFKAFYSDEEQRQTAALYGL